MKLFLRMASLAVVASFAAPLASLAQTYPAKPIRMVLTYAGSIEGATRLVAQKMSEGLGQAVVLDSQPGAAGSIGAANVARAAPDGYTILSSTGSTQFLLRLLTKNVPYDPIRDFTPITLGWETITVLVTSKAYPLNSLQELMEYAKRNPGKISYGTSGNGTTHHFSLELIKQLTGVDIVHIPYKGGAQPLIDVVAERIEVSSSVLASVAPFAGSGKIKYLAVVNDRRFDRIPEVPSVREVIPGFRSPPFWSAFYGPPGLPQPLVKRLNAEIVMVLRLPDVRARLGELGMLVVASTPEELMDSTRAGIEASERIAKAAHLEPQD